MTFLNNVPTKGVSHAGDAWKVVSTPAKVIQAAHWCVSPLEHGKWRESQAGVMDVAMKRRQAFTPMSQSITNGLTIIRSNKINLIATVFAISDNNWYKKINALTNSLNDIDYAAYV